MSNNRVKIESTNSDGEEVVVYVVKPKQKDYTGAKTASNKAFKEAIESGAFLRSRVDEVMREQGLWDDQKEERLSELNKSIRENERKLKRGGIELDEAKKIALEMSDSRREMTQLLAKTRELDSFTVEGQAENAQFDYLVSVCVVDEEGKRVFKDMEDYREKSEESYAYESAVALSKMVYNMDDEWEKELPENKFLLEYGFIDDDLRLVNEDGEYVSEDGRRIDKEGRYLSPDGGYEDVDGNPVDENGDPLEDFQPFTKNGEAISR